MAGKDAKRARPSGAGRTTGRSGKGASAKGGSPKTASAKASGRSDRPAPAPPPATPAHPPTGPLRLGAVPGATPGRWISTWRERMPGNPLELIALTVADQRAALTSGVVDAALVRLPVDRDGLHVIPLYDEVPVVVVPVDSHLTAADELEASDLAGEVLIVAADDVLGFTADGTMTPTFAPLETTDSMAIVAAGAGVLVVPMSIARLHHRRDLDHRPLRDGPTSTVALAWVADRTTPLVEAFVGIVRGRTLNSSR